MKTYSRDLRRARRWLASGRSTKVIRYLEPKVPLFLEDPQYYALLGRACVESGLLKDAQTWLNRGLQADPSHLEVRLALAVNHLKRKDPASAVRTWLEILEDHPEQTHAKRGLKALKRISDQEAQDRFLDRFDPGRFLPDLRSPWPGRILALLIAVLVVLMLLYFRESLTGIARNWFSNRAEDRRSDVRITLEDLDYPLTDPNSGDVLNPMTDREIDRTLTSALDLYNRYEDNLARRELNKIRYSNADAEVLATVAGLIEALGEPDIDTIGTDFGYGEVLDDPWLYDGCWVVWSGAPANVDFGDDSIRFDLLVGYEDGQILEGRVPVEVPFLAVMESLPVEVLGQVETRNGSLVLIAKTLHFLR